MERHFDNELRDLKEQLVGMAGLVERAIENATLALQHQDRSKIGQVFEIEKKVNEIHKRVDDSGVRLLALNQPLANDLRLIVAIIKINTDLERMGDHAVNIAGNTESYLEEEALKPLIDLPVMSEEVRYMVREVIDSFVKTSEELARDVLNRDDRVDSLKNKIFKDVLDLIREDSKKVDQGLNLILIARNLERIGDHATNIAEDVIYAISGEDIRHSSSLETIKDVFNPR